MHAEPESVRKHVRVYWMIGAALFAFTIITVAVNQVHLAIPLAITVALIIAALKGSMVGSIFMHLSSEKKWIYGALLLTVVFFIVLLSVPLLTQMDNIGTPIGASNPSHAEPPRH
ncbi:MAG TPA: cytochrome C oxidase subunit IV family protein [Vicinamibacterales bacterium]|nr:cytochrome C oxidase subunit IV family protein [Vicinamibacterales bacterium]